MSDDAWLDIDEKSGTSGLPACIVLPTTLPERVALLEGCWAKLTMAQRTFLHALRECHMNARAANRKLRGANYTSTSHTKWMQQAEYATVVAVWRAQVANDALDRDRLLARQDDIVETLLVPKPILHQGMPTGFEEVNAAAAGRANEALMTAAGILKSGGKDIEVNVGVVLQGPPTLNIQVMPLPPSKTAEQQNVVIDAKFSEVPSDE